MPPWPKQELFLQVPFYKISIVGRWQELSLQSRKKDVTDPIAYQLAR